MLRTDLYFRNQLTWAPRTWTQQSPTTQHSANESHDVISERLSGGVSDDPLALPASLSPPEATTNEYEEFTVAVVITRVTSRGDRPLWLRVSRPGGRAVGCSAVTLLDSADAVTSLDAAHHARIHETLRGDPQSGRGPDHGLAGGRRPGLLGAHGGRRPDDPVWHRACVYALVT